MSDNEDEFTRIDSFPDELFERILEATKGILQNLNDSFSPELSLVVLQCCMSNHVHHFVEPDKRAATIMVIAECALRSFEMWDQEDEGNPPP